MNEKQTVKLSKLMSYALRHDPASFGLVLDKDGWVGLNDLVRAIKGRSGWRWIRAEQVRQVVETSDKQRFETKGDLIRARYGHSQAAKPTYQRVDPPELLYHGTPRRFLPKIRRDGLKAMSRQYVHLSVTPKMAVQVGRRRDRKPVVLRIRAAEAHKAGIVFGTPSGGEEDIYLVEAVPAAFIDFSEPDR